MITDGFMYIAVLMLISAVIVNLPVLFKNSFAKKFFRFVPPIVLIYLGLMIMCTSGLWDLDSTAEIYGEIKNPVLYGMLFLMLLRCDMRKIIRLGPKMLIGFYTANLSIGVGFILSFMIMHNFIGDDAWKTLGALCGSWMGGGGNMLAVQAALDVNEASMAYALVMDSICATLYIMFLLWAIGQPEKFNRWTKADTRTIDRIGEDLANEAAADSRHITWQNMMLLLGTAFTASSVSQLIGSGLSENVGFFDKTTWTVLTVTFLGIALAMTPLGKIKGTEELSNVMLYIVIALIASRADLNGIGNAPAWLITGFIILLIHVIIMIIMAKLFKMDIFTCAVASLANIGGTATAPVLAGTYSSSLVPVGIIMALLGYVTGTGGGLITARIMEMVI